MTTDVQILSSAAPTMLPELPFIEGIPLCQSFNAKLKMVSKDELCNDEEVHAAYSELFHRIKSRLTALKEEIPETPEQFIEDEKEFEALMRQINAIRRTSGLKEIPAYNLNNGGRYYKVRETIPKEMHWDLQCRCEGRFRRPTGEWVLVLQDHSIVNEREYVLKRQKENLEEYARAIESSEKGVRRYLLWLDDQERAEARARFEALAEQVLAKLPEAEPESDPDDEREWDDHEALDGRDERD